MNLSATARNLYEAIRELTIIDAHQHLPAEKDYLEFGYCGVNMFAGYIQHDLDSAGMDQDFKHAMRDAGFRPVGEWWPMIRPYWEQVKYASFSRALRITARDLYHIKDINDKTIHELAEKVMADNQPGIYHKYLQEICGIEKSITCNDQVSFPDDPGLRGLSVKIMRLVADPNYSRDRVNEWSQISRMTIHSCEDFRELDPKFMLSFAARRQDVRFDMFHLGMPMIRDALMIGKVYHNVTLNMTWSPLISQSQTCQAINEIIDQVPLNKIVAFGGDYRCCVQKTYGHLTLAREAVASELARRIDSEEFDFEEAVRIAKMWLYDNPKRVYSRL